MDDLINTITEAIDIDEDTAKAAVSIMLNFISKNGPDDDVKALTESLDGADSIMALNPDSGDGDIMAAGNELMNAGISMMDLEKFVSASVDYFKEQAGDDTVSNIVHGIPGLDQFA